MHPEETIGEDQTTDHQTRETDHHHHHHRMKGGVNRERDEPSQKCGGERLEPNKQIPTEKAESVIIVLSQGAKAQVRACAQQGCVQIDQTKKTHTHMRMEKLYSFKIG